MDDLLELLKFRADLADQEEQECSDLEESDKDSLFYIRIIGALRGRDERIAELEAQLKAREEMLDAAHAVVKQSGEQLGSPAGEGGEA